MDKFLLPDNIEDDRPKVGHLHPHCVGIEMRAHRMLHPAIGNEDPERRKIGAGRDEPGEIKTS